MHPSLTPKETCALSLLRDRGPLTGMELVSWSTTLADEDGLGKGTVYWTLARLETKGYVSSTYADGPPKRARASSRPPPPSPPRVRFPRRTYALTAAGRRVLDAYEQLGRALEG